MVKALLELNAAPPTDAADALACAICYAHHTVSAYPVPARTRAGSWRALRVGA
jgi:Holliday junction resolvasome RuvABC endonuclease subunit